MFAEQLLTADAAQQPLKRSNLFQTSLANRQSWNLCERFLADAAIGGK